MTPSASPCIGIGLRHPHYAAVFEQRPDVGFLEVHAENFFAIGGAIPRVLDQAAELYPISLHGVGLSLGSASGIDDWHMQQLKYLVGRIDPMLVSDHACFGRAKLGNSTTHANDLLPIRHTASSLVVLCANVNKVQDTLKRRIAVENISAYVRWNEADYSEAGFLNALTQRTGCGVLMDLNNIYVNALNDSALKPTALASCMDWLDSIRAESVMEIHLAGFTPSDTLVIDDHATPVHEPVWQLYQYALKKMGNIPTLIEWDLELPELSVLLGEAAIARRYALEVRS